MHGGLVLVRERTELAAPVLAGGPVGASGRAAGASPYTNRTLVAAQLAMRRPSLLKHAGISRHGGICMATKRRYKSFGGSV